MRDDEDKLAAWYMLMQAVGNITEWYQNCYDGSVDPLFTFYDYIVGFESFTTYLLYAMVNLVSWSFYMTNWVNSYQQAVDDEDLYEEVRILCYIARKLLFFDNSPADLDDLDFLMMYSDESTQVKNPLGIQKDHIFALKEPMERIEFQIREKVAPAL